MKRDMILPAGIFMLLTAVFISCACSQNLDDNDDNYDDDSYYYYYYDPLLIGTWAINKKDDGIVLEIFESGNWTMTMIVSGVHDYYKGTYKINGSILNLTTTHCLGSCSWEKYDGAGLPSTLVFTGSLIAIDMDNSEILLRKIE